jgi:homoserine kinase
MNPKLYSVTAYAPASTANISVGYDILGMALKQPGDRVTVTRIPERTVTILNSGSTDINIPLEPSKNCAGYPLLHILDDYNLNFGFQIEIEKGIPIGSGLGGSASSAVAAVVAANQFLPTPLCKKDLISYCVLGEQIASGSAHADNVAPSLLGGMVAVSQDEPYQCIQLPIHKNLYYIVWYPNIRIDTKDARAHLNTTVPLDVYTRQSYNLVGFLAGLFNEDCSLLQKSLTDLIVEPQRKILISGFDEAKEAAIQSGALGFGISGSGPTCFALCNGPQVTDIVQREVQLVLAKYHPVIRSWSGIIPKAGAIIEQEIYE